MLIGQNDLKNIVLPSGIDAAQLQANEMAEGATYEEILTDINDGLSIAETEAFADPVLGGLIHVTERTSVEYRAGSTNGFEDHTEYSDPDEERSETGGHMLPLKKQDKKLGWSKDYLEVVRRFQIDSDIGNAVTDFKDAIVKRALSRLFSNLAESGKKLGLGDTGKSLPLVDGSSAGGISFTPPRGRDGKNFDSTHNHYLRLNGINQANLELAVEHVWEHGHDGPYDLLASQTDLAAWTNVAVVTGFKERAQSLVQYGVGATLSLVDEIYVGTITTKFGSVRLMVSGRVPSNRWSVRKVYGNDDPRNTIWYRINPKRGKAPWLEVPFARVIPVQGAIILYQGGYAIGEDRTNGVCVYNAASGSYDPGVIS